MTTQSWEPFQNAKVRKPTVRKPRTIQKCPTEQQEQFVLVAWLRKMGIRHHHSPNGGQRHILEAAKFKRLGTSKGYPDLIIPYPMNGYATLHIELKRVKGGSISPEQKEWLEWLNVNGHLALVAKGAEEGKQIICDYLGLNPIGIEINV